MNADSIDRMLHEFAADSKAFMGHLPVKRDRDGNVLDKPFTAFAAEDIASQRYITGRDAGRRRHFRVEDGVVISLETVPTGGAEAVIGWRDRPEELVDRLEHETLESLEGAGLTAASLDETPWSDDYWAIYLGQLGKRYADPDFPADPDWELNYNAVVARPAADVLSSGDGAAIDNLAPSEKYDALIGDRSFSFTQYMWQTGRYYYERYGEVETWMGACHGWAPAAYMLPRPARAVTVPAADGSAQLTFYPADIKALATQLWAQAQTSSRFIGGRCNDKQVKTDEIGRVVDSKCFDTNPGSWHLAVTNQIGVGRRSFIIDATYDFEVWNQPVFSYRTAYFNPRAMRYRRRLADAVVAVEDFDNDPFSRYRSSGARYIAGMVMEVAYVVETSPTHATEDGPQQDAVQKVVYFYDLELDAQRKIIGGEWYQNRHPDFLWTPPIGTRAKTEVDRYVQGTWSADGVVPESWRVLARSVSPQGLPLAAIVEALIERARL